MREGKGDRGNVYIDVELSLTVLHEAPISWVCFSDSCCPLLGVEGSAEDMLSNVFLLIKLDRS